jgi:hypothetical protein
MLKTFELPEDGHQLRLTHVGALISISISVYFILLTTM